jgi:hypothetical protein
MKNTQEKLRHLKDLLTIVNDQNIKQAVKDKAWLELWSALETSCGKIVNQTISKHFKHGRPSSDLVQDAILESVSWVIANSKSWDPKKGASPATWAFRKIAQITMNVVGVENVTIDIDESKEDGAIKKQELEMQLLEDSSWGRKSSSAFLSESEVEHPFDMLANLDNPVVSLLLEALQYLLGMGLIKDDDVTICAERVMGTEYSIIAAYHAKSENATRQSHKRCNQALKALNLEMPRYADLIKLPMIANVVNGKASKKGK